MPDLLAVDPLYNVMAQRTFSAIIFKNGSTYYARKYDGSLISSGTVAETVLQAAWDLGGSIYHFPANYDITSAGLTMSADTHLEFARGAKLRAPNNTVITLITLSDVGWNCSINGLYTDEQTSNTKKYNGIKITSATSTGVAFLRLTNCYIYKPDTGIELETTNAAGYVNDCRLSDIVVHGPKTAGVLIDQITNGDIDKNKFDSVGIQMDSDSVVGFKNIDGHSNSFTNCVVWDCPITATEANIASTAQGIQIRGGAMTGYNGYFINQGTRTVSQDLGLSGYNTFSFTPDVIKVGSWFGSDQTNGIGILDGRITESVVGTGSSSPTEDSTGIYRTFDTGATTNSIIGHRMGRTMLRGDNAAYYKTKIRTGSSIANTRIFCGLKDSSSAPSSTGDPLNAANGIGLWYDDGVNANWRRLHNDGSGASTSDNTSLAVATSTSYIVEIYYNVPNSEWRFRFNGVETAITSDVPANTTNLGFYTQIENTTGSSRTLRCYYEIVSSNK